MYYLYIYIYIFIFYERSSWGHAAGKETRVPNLLTNLLQSNKQKNEAVCVYIYIYMHIKINQKL